MSELALVILGHPIKNTAPITHTHREIGLTYLTAVSGQLFLNLLDFMIGHHLNTPQLHALNNLAQSKLVKMAAS